MSGPGSIVAAALLGLLIIALGDVISEEVRARLDQLPYVIIGWAARRLPGDCRADFSEEWEAELTAILVRHNALTLPITRLVVGVRYACGLLRVSRDIGRTLAAPVGGSGPGPRLWIRRGWDLFVAPIVTFAPFAAGFDAMFAVRAWVPSQWVRLGVAPAAGVLIGLVVSVELVRPRGSFSVRSWSRLAGRRFVQFLRLVSCLGIGFLAACLLGFAICLMMGIHALYWVWDLNGELDNLLREYGLVASSAILAVALVLGTIVSVAGLWTSGRAVTVARCLLAGGLLAWLSEALVRAISHGHSGPTALGWAPGCVGAFAFSAGATVAVRWRPTVVPMTVLGGVLLLDAVSIVYLARAPAAQVATLVIGSAELAAVAVWLATRRPGLTVFGSLLAVASASLVFSFFQSLPAHNAFVSCVTGIIVGVGTAAVAGAATRDVVGGGLRSVAAAVVCVNAIVVVDYVSGGGWFGAAVLVLVCAGSVLPRMPRVVMTGAVPNR